MTSDEARVLQDELRARVLEWYRRYPGAYVPGDPPIDNLRLALVRARYSDKLPPRGTHL